MRPEMPGLIEWNSNLSIGVDSIDSQHQSLVAIIRRLQEAMLDNQLKKALGELFREMNEYTRYHFEYEERLMGQYDYPDSELHRGQHARLIARLQELECKHAAGTLNAGAPVMQFLRTWLMEHIAGHDKKFGAFLQGKGAS